MLLTNINAPVTLVATAQADGTLEIRPQGNLYSTTALSRQRFLMEALEAHPIALVEAPDEPTPRRRR